MSDLNINFNENYLRTEIAGMLIKLGVPFHLKGFNYLCYAIYLTVINDVNDPLPLVEGLYTEVERKFSLNPKTAERNMRTAIDAAFLYGDPDTLYKMFGSKKKVSNGKFIRTAAYEFIKKESKISSNM